MLGRFGCGCGEGQSAWGAGIASLLQCPLCLLIYCNGGEGGTVCSSIWLFIEEAGVVGFVMFEGCLPCACVQFVCRASCGCGVVMGFAFGRELEDSGLHLRFICGFVWRQSVGRSDIAAISLRCLLCCSLRFLPISFWLRFCCEVDIEICR